MAAARRVRSAAVYRRWRWRAKVAAALVLLAGCSGGSDDAADVPAANAPTTVAPAVGALPPNDELLVAITRTSLVVIDARTLTLVHRVHVLDLMPPVAQERALEFVLVMPDKRSAIVTVNEVRSERYSLWEVDFVADRVTLIRDGASQPAVSPDGKQLSYAVLDRPSFNGHAIGVRDRASGAEKVLAQTAPIGGLDFVGSPIWAPDNRTLAYSRGYYGYDTYLVDTATAVDLASNRKLEKVGITDWRAGVDPIAWYFCCYEAEPGVLVRYNMITQARTVLGLPPMLGFADFNDQDGRVVGVDQTSGQNIVTVADHDGRLRPLLGYFAASW